MKTIYHPLRFGQKLGTHAIVGRPHVHAIAAHAGPLFHRQTLQALGGRRFVAPRHHRQYLGMLRIAQVREQRHVQLVPLLEADLIHPDIADDLLGIHYLGRAHLVLDDPRHRLRGNAQAAGHFFLVAADHEPHHVLLETIRVTGVLAFEGRDQILAVMAALATVKSRWIGPKTGLAAHVQVAHDPCLAGEFPAGLLLMATAWAAPPFGPGPIDLEAMRLAAALITGKGDSLGQVDVDGDVGHGRPWQLVDRCPPFPPVDFPVFQPKQSRPARIPQIRWVSQLKTEEPIMTRSKNDRVLGSLPG